MSRSPLVAGADGCRAGWIRLERRLDTRRLRATLHSSAQGLLGVQPAPAVLAIDIPIGLPERGRRDCDALARRCLAGPRRSSVFPAPIRPALRARSRVEAARITERADGRKVGAQAWGLYAKVREVDAVLRRRPRLRERVHEVHPEVSFWAWNCSRAMRFSKRTGAGGDERPALLARHFGRRAFDGVRESVRRSDAGDDDILDAFALLWTAERIWSGAARGLPEVPPRDATGLPMEIVY